MWVIGLVVGIFGVFWFIAWALARAAGLADRDLERMYEAMRKREEK